MRSPSWLALVGLLAALPLGGCARSSQVQLRSTGRTNGGNTLYVMVRAVDRATAAENYQDVAARLFADPPDATVIHSQPVFPGNPVTLSLDASDKKDLVLYFFFTEPGPSWRLPLPRPLPREVVLDLGERQIERVQVQR